MATKGETEVRPRVVSCQGLLLTFINSLLDFSSQISHAYETWLPAPFAINYSTSHGRWRVVILTAIL
jgi:hypothetical protein